MQRLFKWLAGKLSPRKNSDRPALSRTGTHARQAVRPQPAIPKQAVPRRQPEFVELEPSLEGRIEDNGPGKNVLIRNKFVRLDAGTHETLTILDDSMVDSNEEDGIDPYNTGQFDRSKNWDKRSRD